MELPFTWRLDSTMGKRPYSKSSQVKNTHLGQRKLLVGEVEFLSEVYNNYSPGATVLYVGSSPGHSISLLQELFPGLIWVLWDPAPMAKGLKVDWKTTTFHKNFFTDDVASSMSPKPDIFISDIRLGVGKAGGKAFEEAVWKDLKSQARWIELLGFPASWIKFRLPYDLPKQEFEFWRGEIRFQCWEKPTSGSFFSFFFVFLRAPVQVPYSTCVI
eukprot:Lithocolla_globosa_v1_NODE_6472_length_1083_cov_3.628405.p1 type:complete len:215 gc:universal NODE_6472_length_1083_cov_3.628405:867-223(-)